MKQLVALAVTLAPSLVLAASGGHGGHGEPTINWWTWQMDAPPVGWYIVDFIVFVGLLGYFLKKPLQRVFAERHDVIKSAIAANEAAFLRTKAEYDESRGKLAAVEHDVIHLVQKLKEDGGAERDRIVGAAKEYAVRLEKDSKTIIAYEAQAARERLHKSVAQRALAAAEELLVAELTPKDRERMVDDAIAEIEKVEALGATHKRRSAGREQAGGDAAGGAR